MHTAHLPFIIVPSHSARAVLGANLPKAAVLALRAILINRKSLEVAHQQIRFGKHQLVFSSRIGSKGDLILELDLGDPRLRERLILENDLRRAEHAARGHARLQRP
jgi:hypothetical protein